MKNDNAPLDWPSLLNHLTDSNIDFLVVGGGALVLHGIPRTTLDLDIYVPCDVLIAKELISLLKDKLCLNIKDENFFNLIDRVELLEGQWIAFSIPNGPDIIDVYFCRKGMFNKLHETADIVEINTAPVHVANISTLISMKEKSGRPIDLADIALMEEYKSLLDE